MNVRTCGWVLAAAVLASSAGCFSPEVLTSKSFHHGMPSSAPPVDQIRQVVPIWENRTVTTQDVVNQGQPLVGLAGRVYFFGEEMGHPLSATGTLTVDAHEFLPDGKTRMLERWEIDAKTLMKLGRTDKIGFGYTVFLPWSTYRPDIARVQLQAKFVPAGGEARGYALFSPPSPVTLRQEGSPVITSSVYPASATK
jgi:hypothetical protein